MCGMKMECEIVLRVHTESFFQYKKKLSLNIIYNSGVFLCDNSVQVDDSMRFSFFFSTLNGVNLFYTYCLM